MQLNKMESTEERIVQQFIAVCKVDKTFALSFLEVVYPTMHAMLT